MTMEAPVGNPLVVTVKVPAMPTMNVVALALVIVGGAFTLRLTIFWPVQPPPSVAVIVAVKGPLCVGVPVTSPELEPMLTPFGRLVADQVIVPGLPLCEKCAVAIA